MNSQITKNSKKEDLRVVKTKRAIRQAFEEMICEMDYDQIQINELTDRALINRKTFYLHYNNLDDLLDELQDEIADQFISQNVSYHSINDIKRIIRFFYEFAVSMPLLNERLLCSGSYSHVGSRINEKIMAYQAKTNGGAFSDNEYEDRLVFAYFASNSTVLYRQWVKDGKKMPVEDLIKTATRLICNGMEPFVKG